MDVLSFETEVRQLIGLQQEGEYWDFKKEWYQNKADLLHDIICMANNLSNQDGLIIIGVDEENDYSISWAYMIEIWMKNTRYCFIFAREKICWRYPSNSICPTSHFVEKDNRYYCYS